MGPEPLTGLAALSPTARAAYAGLLSRLRTDLAELRRTSSNIDAVAAPLKLVELHVFAEVIALERSQDRAHSKAAALRKG